MRKKILFVMESMRIGGAEKSLLTVLDKIDYEKFDVDLFLFNHSGELLKFIPKNVNILNESEDYKIFIKNRKLSPIRFIIKGNLKKSYICIKYLFNVLRSRIKKEKLYIGWDIVSNLFPKLEKNYDIAIGFLERKTIYFTVDKVNAKKKIGFIHNDYSSYPYDYIFDNNYFAYFDKIVTVSNHCKEVLKDIFPNYKSKFYVLENMVNEKLIKEMAKEKVSNINKNIINIVSVGRIEKQKGFDKIISISKILLNKGYRFNWYIIGDGSKKKELEKMIKINNLNNVFLIGSTTNPYKWMNIANIYVQPSNFEGFGITVKEAKVLNKALVLSNIKEFKEQIKDLNIGYLCDEINDYVNKIENLIKNKNYIKIEKNYKNIKSSNEINNFYELIK